MKFEKSAKRDGRVNDGAIEKLLIAEIAEKLRAEIAEKIEKACLCDLVAFLSDLGD